MSLPRNLLFVGLLVVGVTSTNGLATPPPKTMKQQQQPNSRRAFLSTFSATAAAFSLTIPKIANARYILNEETGDYDEVTDDDWQTTWGKRLDKAKSMGTEDVFLAAQGAGNLDMRAEGFEESEASKKRRAIAGCRNDGIREKSGMKGAKECTARVLGGDYQFMIDAM